MDKLHYSKKKKGPKRGAKDLPMSTQNNKTMSKTLMVSDLIQIYEKDLIVVAVASAFRPFLKEERKKKGQRKTHQEKAPPKGKRNLSLLNSYSDTAFKMCWEH